MKSIILSVLGMAMVSTSIAHAADLTVKVDDIRADKGKLMLAVYDSAAGWDGKAKPVAAQALDAAGDSVMFHFEGLAAGTYAISVMHDENGNGKLDTNFVGMPIEGYGFSNDPKVMRKATFAEASFAVDDKGTAIELHLR